ncbi:dynactin subunit 1 isoform X2 [Leptinotarsa decemlineata]|uniref:dynactin subunit 1 isoform X2 n=1 Tax=Leptinotarsa decemlineata TaxID=7539 RepID=UPI003D30990D
MSEYMKIGRRVEVTGKGVQGIVAFVGKTNFAAGNWIGLVLDEPKGKNNGSVKGHEYFKCEENHGMFVRDSQVVPLDENGKPIENWNEGQAGVSKIARNRQSRIGTKPKPTTVRRKTSPKGTPSLSASSSRMSLASSRQSLAGSRQSLAGSRQSLAGSRNHLASPPSEKPAEGTESMSQIPKRASFVETGFVETLKPQFTPGHAMTTTPTPITSVDEKISQLQFQTELENRSQQIRDLVEKLETLKLKRQEDKEKLKDYDKLKIQLEQLVEFKSKIMSAQASLQRDLQKAKQEAKEAIEAKEAHEEEVSDLAEAVEMATLDKEMAEEKAETLQLELDFCKEKLEEVTLDLEILKTEMQERTSASGGMASGEGQPSAYEIKQLQQQNARLRETLVRLRDLSAHEKHEYQKLMKDIDQKKSEITELGKTKEKLSSRVEEMEQQIADLQEQVDAALGAEEMVVILSDQKLTLEEKVVQLMEEVSELEALQDMNDQLVESNAELEADLREELDMALAATREAMRDRDAALETIADREQTIGKFRNLVHQLQEQSLDLQHRLEKETSKPVSALPEIIDFKKMFSETKAHTKAIDLEIRRIEIQQLQQHIKYLSAYMPDSFMNRGGDHDAVLITLLIPRLIQKTEILASQIKDKFPSMDKVDRAAIIKSHSVEQYAFRCRISFYIFAIQTILRQYFYALNNCKPEVLLKVGSAYPEMAGQEKIIDGYVELIKRDQLDENVPVEVLEKCVIYFNNLFPVLLGPTVQNNQTQLLADNVKCLSAVVDGFTVDALILRSLMETSNIGDIGLLAQHVITTSDLLQQQLKLVKRRLPPDASIANLGLSKETIENLYQCYQQAGKIIKTLHDIVKTTIQTLLSEGGMENGISQEKLKEIAHSASDKVYEQDDLGPVQSIKNSLTYLLNEATKIAQFLLDNEYEISTASSSIDEKVPPIQIRAESVKKELEQTKTLTSKLENKESDIKELRKLLKEKQEQLSEMTIRKELAEKKLGNVNKDYELTIEKLQRKLEEAHNYYKKKDKEFEETLDHLQSDIDSLENEKGEMKEKLKLLSKKTALEVSLSKSMSGSQLPSLQSLGPNIPAVVKDSPLLMQEIENLRKLFHQERNERLKLQSDKLKEQLDSMKPLPSFKNTRDEILENLFKEGAALKQEILMALAKPSFPQIYKTKPGNGPAAWKRHFIEEQNRMLDLKRRAERFQSKVAAETVRRKHGGRIETDFTIFPTKEMTKALNEDKPVNIGFVKIPKTYLPMNEKPKIVNLELDFENLQKILNTLMNN